jgi:hypothetical protein
MRAVPTTVIAVALLAMLALGAELPKPTDEEDSMRVSPDHMKCDTCAGSLFHIWWKFKKWHDKFPNRRMRESEVLESVDESCMPRSFATTYGIKKVGDTHHLSGDGLKWFSVQSPTVGTLQPGMWLTDACRVTQGEVGEEVLYEMFNVYHKQMALEKSDVAMFRDVCIKRRKQCTLEEGLATFDRFEKEDLKVELADIDE